MNLADLRSGRLLSPPSWQPYPLSPLYDPIVGTSDGSSGSPSIHPDSGLMVAKFAATNPSQPLAGDDSSDRSNAVTRPVFFSGPGDPWYTVRKVSGGFSSDWWDTKIRIPRHAVPANGSDHHLAVIDSETGIEWFMWDVWRDFAATSRFNSFSLRPRLSPSGGDIYASTFAKHDVNGDMTPLGALTGENLGGSTAAKWGALAGTIRIEELMAGVIEHALYLVTGRTDGQIVLPSLGQGAYNRATLNGSHVFPMTAGSVSYTNMVQQSNAASPWTTVPVAGRARLPNGSLFTYTSYTGTATSGTFNGVNGGTGTHASGSFIYEHDWPPCGARVQLNMTAQEIEDLVDTGANNSARPWNKTVLHALRKYGAFLGDNGGTSFSIGRASGLSQYALTGIDPWREWAAVNGLLYNVPLDVFEFDLRSFITWSSKLRVLDWNDPLNR